MTDIVEFVEKSMAVGDAERLDKRIRLMAGTLRDNSYKIAALVEEAKKGQIHIALGFVSWTAYLADAIGGQLNLDTEARRSVVELMSCHGASQRAIAMAVGVSQKTVSRDLEVSHNDSPGPAGGRHEGGHAAQSRVTGLDGKTYSPPRTRRKPPRRALADEAQTLSSELGKLNGKLQKLLDDDRFERNRDAIANQLRPQGAIGIALLNRLTAVDAQSPTAGVA